jgi:hypothetical protein
MCTSSLPVNNGTQHQVKKTDMDTAKNLATSTTTQTTINHNTPQDKTAGAPTSFLLSDTGSCASSITFLQFPNEIVVRIINVEPTLLLTLLLTNHRFDTLWEHMFNLKCRGQHDVAPSTVTMLMLFKNPLKRSEWGQDIVKARCKWAQEKYGLPKAICEQIGDGQLKLADALANRKEYAIQMHEVQKKEHRQYHFCKENRWLMMHLRPVPYVDYPSSTFDTTVDDLTFRREVIAIPMLSGHFSLPELFGMDSIKLKWIEELLQHCYTTKCYVQLHHIIQCVKGVPIQSKERLFHIFANKTMLKMISRDQLTSEHIVTLTQLDLERYTDFVLTIQHKEFKRCLAKGPIDIGPLIKMACYRCRFDPPLTILRKLLDSNLIHDCLFSGEFQMQDMLALFNDDNSMLSELWFVVEHLDFSEILWNAKSFTNIMKKHDNVVFNTIKNKKDLYFPPSMAESNSENSNEDNTPEFI